MASLCFQTQGAEHERSQQRGHWYLESAPQEEQGLGFGGGGGGSRSSSASAAASEEATAAVGAASSAVFSNFPSLGSLVLSFAASPVKCFNGVDSREKRGSRSGLRERSRRRRQLRRKNEYFDIAVLRASFALSLPRPHA